MFFCNVIACQSAMSGMLRNMPLLKTRLSGLIPKIVWMPVRMACVAINSILSMKSFALVTSHGGSPCRRVVERFPLFDASAHRLHWLVDFYLMLEHLWSCILWEEIGTLVLQLLHHYCVHRVLVKDIISIARLGRIFLPRVPMLFHQF